MTEERSHRLLDALEARTDTALGQLQAFHERLEALNARLAELEAERLELKEENRELDEQNRELEEHNARLLERLKSGEPAPAPPARGRRRAQGLSALIGHRSAETAPPSAEPERPEPSASAPSDSAAAETTSADTTSADTSPTPGPDEAAEVNTGASSGGAGAPVESDQQGSLAIEPAPSAEALLDQWYRRYPQAFFKGHTRPLKVGIHLDLAADEPWPEKLVRRALAGYVNLPRYLKAVREGAERIDLAGRPQGRVDAQAAEHARRKLERLQAERRRKPSAAGGKGRAARGGRKAKPAAAASGGVQPDTSRKAPRPDASRATPTTAAVPPGSAAQADTELPPGADSASPEQRLEAKLSALLAKHGGGQRRR